ncbi:polysaccharide deacetylase family protein [Pontibacter sp. MBLB2868]|uniref:polysaccharide deacetylase family protein n=1 Tax=Pontibacter sp. MBLB2868 TaxID=3451555 RepID=UPI003F74E8CA
MIHLFKTPWLLKKLLPAYTWHKEVIGQKLYLTFDDGPIPAVTPWVLDQLDKYGARATFFCVGDNLVKYPDIAEQIIKQGHVLANHTFNHLKGWQTDEARYVRNVALCQKEVEKYAADRVRPLFRPPYGRITSKQAKQLQDRYEIIMWDVLTNDYDSSLGQNRCLQKSISSTQSGSIIVFHDSLKARKNMMYVLPRYLEHFTNLGYTFDTL